MSSASSALCKVEFNGDIRRFHLSPAHSIEALHAQLRNLYGFDDHTMLRLVYTDPEGDHISIYSDNDLLDAWQQTTGSPRCYRLSLQPSSSPLFARAPTQSVASSVWCNVCRATISLVETRYKCGICADFDLCARCEALPTSHDRSHILLKLAPEAQALYPKLPTSKPILSSLSTAPSSAPAQPPIDLGSLYQSFTRPQAPGQPSILNSFLSALGGDPNHINTGAPQADPLSSIFSALQQGGANNGNQPDLSQLLQGLGSIDFNKLFGHIAQPQQRQPAPTPAPAPAPAPTSNPIAEQQLREGLRSMGYPEDQIELAIVASGGDPSTALALLIQDN